MIPMMNTYDTIRENLHFNKFAVGSCFSSSTSAPLASTLIPGSRFENLGANEQFFKPTSDRHPNNAIVRANNPELAADFVSSHRPTAFQAFAKPHLWFSAAVCR